MTENSSGRVFWTRGSLFFIVYMSNDSLLSGKFSLNTSSRVRGKKEDGRQVKFMANITNEVVTKKRRMREN